MSLVIDSIFARYGMWRLVSRGERTLWAGSILFLSQHAYTYSKHMMNMTIVSLKITQALVTCYMIWMLRMTMSLKLVPISDDSRIELLKSSTTSHPSGEAKTKEPATAYARSF